MCVCVCDKHQEVGPFKTFSWSALASRESPCIDDTSAVGVESGLPALQEIRIHLQVILSVMKQEVTLGHGGREGEEEWDNIIL